MLFYCGHQKFNLTGGFSDFSVYGDWLRNIYLQCCANIRCITISKFSFREDRSLNSHSFTMCYIVSLPFSQSQDKFFNSHGFTNLRRWNSQFCGMVSNFVIYDLESATRSCPGNGCPHNYQKFYGKYPSSINLIKVVLFMGSFGNHLKVF